MTAVCGVVQRSLLTQEQDRRARAMLAELLSRLRRIPGGLTDREEQALAYVAHGEPMRLDERRTD